MPKAIDGDLPGASGEHNAPQPGPLAPPPASPPGPKGEANAGLASTHHGLTLQSGGGQSGGSSAFAGAAERIGAVIGTAQRQLRHGLKLVQPADRITEADTDWDVQEDVAAEMMEEIEKQVAEIRPQAAARLMLFRPAAEEHPLRTRLSDFFARIAAGANRPAVQRTFQALAAVLGLALALRAALRMRRTCSR